MPEVTNLRAAVVGTGFIGAVHVDALRRLGVEVAGVVGSSPERARAESRPVPLPEPYESFEAMLADERVDVVHLTTPNHLHYAQVKRGARGRQARRLREAARDRLGASRRSCSSSPSERARPLHELQHPLLPAGARRRAPASRAGELGEVWNVHGGYLQDWLLLADRLELAARARRRAASCARSATSARTGSTSSSSSTGREVEAVFADLATTIPVRQRPAGEVETFARGRRRRARRRADGDRGPRASCCCASSGGARGSRRRSRR